MEERLVSRLALERCEINLAHICALIHTNHKNEIAKDAAQDAEMIMHIVSNINRDISLLKKSME